MTRIAQQFDECVSAWSSTKKLSLLEFGVSGYDNDPRALFAIPEVCRWARTLHKHFPFLIAFIDLSTLIWFLPAVAPIEVLSATNSQTAWKLKPGTSFATDMEAVTSRFISALAETQAEYDLLMGGFASRLQSVMNGGE